MKRIEFIQMAKQHLPALDVEDKYESSTTRIDDHWKRQIIYWGSTSSLPPMLEVILTYSPDGFGKKSNKKYWNVFVEKHKGKEWSVKVPFRSWH